jgi:regulator of protease activity HflC (stomatin/prohibitin superfamily)
MNDKWGVYIENIRIKSLSLKDNKLAEKLAEPVIANLKTAAALANIKSQTEIQNAEAQRDADIKKIEADTKYYIQIKEAEAKSKSIEIETTAEANKIVNLANAQANGILILAKAEKEKLILEGDGHQKFAEKVSTSPLGKELAICRLQVDAMKGVEKVIYTPNNSLAPFLFQNVGDK